MSSSVSAASGQDFDGWAMPLGQSLICVGSYSDGVGPSPRDTDTDRGRCLLMYRNVFVGAGIVWLGLLATTRARGGFEPHAAPMLLFRVERRIPDSELEEFKRAVTLTGSQALILRHDFGGLSRGSRKVLDFFLESGPHDARKRDLSSSDGLLKLEHDRFQALMPPVLDDIYRNKRVKAPFKENWREAFLAAREE
jgi:hypothetical protein